MKKKIKSCCFKARVSLILSDMSCWNSWHANQDPKHLLFYAQPGAGKIKVASKTFDFIGGKLGNLSRAYRRAERTLSREMGKNAIRWKKHSDEEKSRHLFPHPNDISYSTLHYWNSKESFTDIFDMVMRSLRTSTSKFFTENKGLAYEGLWIP